MQRYTAAGEETDSNEETAYVTYDILLRRHIVGDSTSSLTAAPTSATSDIEVEQVQASGAPISGKYKIKCADSAGYTETTTALDWNSS